MRLGELVGPERLAQSRERPFGVLADDSIGLRVDDAHERVDVLRECSPP